MSWVVGFDISLDWQLSGQGQVLGGCWFDIGLI